MSTVGMGGISGGAEWKVTVGEKDNVKMGRLYWEDKSAPRGARPMSVVFVGNREIVTKGFLEQVAKALTNDKELSRKHLSGEVVTVKVGSTEYKVYPASTKVSRVASDRFSMEPPKMKALPPRPKAKGSSSESAQVKTQRKLANEAVEHQKKKSAPTSPRDETEGQ